MRVVIAGAGEVGRHLAKMLSRERHDIVLLDLKEENLAFAKTGMEILPITGNPTSLHDLVGIVVRTRLVDRQRQQRPQHDPIRRAQSPPVRANITPPGDQHPQLRIV